MTNVYDWQRVLRGLVIVAQESARLQDLTKVLQRAVRDDGAAAANLRSAPHTNTHAATPVHTPAPQYTPAAPVNVSSYTSPAPSSIAAPLERPIEVVAAVPAPEPVHTHTHAHTHTPQAPVEPVVKVAAPIPPPGPTPAAPTPSVSPPPRPPRTFKEVSVPASPLARVLGFGGLAARMAAGAVGEAVSKAVWGPGDGVGARDGAQPGGGSTAPGSPAVTISEKQAERLAEGLCRMRGAALKIGQMLSLSDESMLPPNVAKVLERVRTQADIMPRRQLERQLVAELGADWREKLGGDAFQMQPVAAASIGQVHRTRLPDGRDVAVKIQYPGVAESINSDLNNLKTLLTVANFLPKGLYLDSLIAVAREELTAECDYRLEAASQMRFRSLASTDADFEVPEVVPEVSTRRVLVTTWLEGAPIDTLMSDSVSQETRNRVARKLLRLTLKELFEWRFMQTDPNWGNFFYNPARSTIGLLDFGATREYSKAFVDDYLRLVWAAANRDRKTIQDVSLKLGFLTGLESQVMLDAHVDSGLVVGEPFVNDAPFDFKASGITARVGQYGAVFAEHRLTPPPPEVYSLHRRLAGAFLMCIRFGAVMRCRDLLEATYSQHQWGS